MGTEGRSGVRSAIALAATGLISVLITAGCGPGSPGDSPRFRLAAYDGCSDLAARLRTATAAHVGPYGLGGSDPMMRPLPSGRVPGDAPATPPSHSTTNVQEPGVDEPDLVKTDGRRVVTYAQGRLHVVDAASRKETGALDLSGGRPWGSGELLLSGDRALVILRPVATFAPGDLPGTPRTPVPASTGPRIVLADLSGPPRVVSSVQADGAYVDARQIGSVARIVLRSTPHIMFPQRRGGTPAQATAANREAVRHAPASAWLPRYSVTRADRTRDLTVPCDRVSHPPAYTGASMLSVFTVGLTGDMADLAPMSVATDAQTMYASDRTLYLADRGTGPGARGTDIYALDLGGSGRPRFAAYGSVPGEPLNQYAMSEYGGYLRVATTSGPAPAGPGPLPPRLPLEPAPNARESATANPPSATTPTTAPRPPAKSPATEPPGTAPPTTAPAGQSSVYVLQRRGDRLARIGAVGGLGRGERIYSVRFAGPVGYVSTFRETDPLYTIDLRDPAKPRVTGELGIDGYSAYLHPAGDGRLIGVGQNADARGRRLGIQVSLFDVSDPARPRKTAGYTIAAGSSTAEFDPHAFLYRPDTGLTALPLATARSDGALLLSVTSGGIRRLGRIDQSTAGAAVQRVVLTGGTLWTLSPLGLQANDAKSLAKTAWLPFTN